MSVICKETREILGRDRNGYYAATRSDAATFTALSKSVVDRIPEDQRRRMQSNGASDGVDVHQASGALLATMALGPFLFSVTREATAMYLPQVSELY